MKNMENIKNNIKNISCLSKRQTKISIKQRYKKFQYNLNDFCEKVQS